MRRPPADQVWYWGACLQIIQCPDAQETWEEAIDQVGNNTACPKNLRARLKRLADTRYLRSPGQFRHEGDGIWAVKPNCGLRAYGWFSEDGPFFVISHYIMKKKDKLDTKDKERALRNRGEWEDG